MIGVIICYYHDGSLSSGVHLQINKKRLDTISVVLRKTFLTERAESRFAVFVVGFRSFFCTPQAAPNTYEKYQKQVRELAKTSETQPEWTNIVESCAT